MNTKQYGLRVNVISNILTRFVAGAAISCYDQGDAKIETEWVRVFWVHH